MAMDAPLLLLLLQQCGVSWRRDGSMAGSGWWSARLLEPQPIRRVVEGPVVGGCLVVAAAAAAAEGA